MKRIVKAGYVLIVGLIVFTGALFIAQGMRQARQTAGVQTVLSFPNDAGSAI